MDTHFFSKTLVVALVLVGALTALPASAQTILCAVDTSSGNLLELNDTTGAIVNTTPITVAGETVSHGIALALQPGTNVLYAILRFASTGQVGQLVTLNATTGVAQSVGNTGEIIVSITFDDLGVLYGVSGNGGGFATPVSPQTLYTLSLVDGTRTLLTVLGNGDRGEVIAFNVNDGLLYHASGRTTQVFETINRSTLAITNIPLSGVAFKEMRGLVYDSAQGDFVMTGETLSNIETLFRVSTSGVVSSIGALLIPFGQNVRGLAFKPAVPPVPAATYWGLGAISVALTLGGAFYMRRLRRSRKA